MAFLKQKRFNKHSIRQNLESIYGIGRNSAVTICKQLGFLPLFTFKTLREDQLYSLLTYIEKSYFLIENNFKRYQNEKRKFANKLRNFKGIRNKVGYPTRGQRTHTNANTKYKLKNG